MEFKLVQLSPETMLARHAHDECAYKLDGIWRCVTATRIEDNEMTQVF